MVKSIESTVTMADKDASIVIGEGIDSRYAYFGVFLSAVAFQIANQILVIVGPPKCVQTEEWKFRNLFISWIHALIVGIWDILCFVIYPDLLDDPVTWYNYFAYSMIAVSTGYFFYDFIDICRNKPIKSQWEVLLHHIAVSSMFFYNIVTCQCIGYNVIALTAEINSMFLHSRKLLQLMQVDFNSTLYRVNAWMNIFTFVVCRFGGMVAIFTGMVMWYNRVTTIYVVSLTLSMVVMSPVNIILFNRLLKNDVYRFRKNAYHNKYRHPSESKPQENGISSSNNNKAKNGTNGHVAHYQNGVSNGVVRSANHNDNEKKDM